LNFATLSKGYKLFLFYDFAMHSGDKNSKHSQKPQRSAVQLVCHTKIQVQVEVVKAGSIEKTRVKMGKTKLNMVIKGHFKAT
jgi:hypothetical protein